MSLDRLMVLYMCFDDMVMGKRNREDVPVVFDAVTKLATDITL
jgi:hypothetical protein